ncbi:MAG: hypothetical protein ACOY3K_05730 [Candidatus Omnitrophota bacterium]
MKKDRGFALVLTLALVVGISAVVAGSMLNAARSQKQIWRQNLQIKMEWSANAIIDRGIKLFRDYIVLTSAYPPKADDQRVRGAKEVEGESAPDYFDAYLVAWWEELMATLDAGSLPFEIRDRMVKDYRNIEIMTIRVIEVDRHLLDFHRRYEIAIAMKHTPSKTEKVVSLTFRLSRANLFEYSVFFDTDLEIAPGPDFILEGPVFTNYNAYLMSGINKTLTISSPFDGSAKGTLRDFALRASGNIYFYFKRGIGRNYMLYNDDGTEKENLYAEAIAPDYVRDPNQRERLPLTFDYAWASSAQKPIDTEAISLRPLFYYFSNMLALSNVTQHHIQFQDGAAVYPVMIEPFSRANYQWVWAEGNPGSFTAYDLPDYNAWEMSISPAYSKTNLPMIDGAWALDNPGGTVKPLTNPGWTNYYGRAGLVSENSPRLSLPIGDLTGIRANNPNHVLIEPLSASDSAQLKSVKLQSFADLTFQCADAICSDHSARLKDGTVLDSTLTAGGIGLAGVRDYRLGSTRRSDFAQSTFRTLVIDIGLLKTFLEETYPDKIDSGYTVYVQTASMLDPANVTDTSVRLVRLVNGTRLPSGGLTLVSNGRVWVQGDYNVYDVNGNLCPNFDLSGQRIFGTVNYCEVPPASIFSDSFGVLSNEWNDTGQCCTFSLPNGGQSWEKQAYYHRVQNDVTVNAALVTGILPSQLQPMYNRCAGVTEWDENFGTCAWWKNDSGYYISYFYPYGTACRLCSPYKTWDSWGTSVGNTGELGVYGPHYNGSYGPYKATSVATSHDCVLSGQYDSNGNYTGGRLCGRRRDPETTIEYLMRSKMLLMMRSCVMPNGTNYCISGSYDLVTAFAEWKNMNARYDGSPDANAYIDIDDDINDNGIADPVDPLTATIPASFPASVTGTPSWWLGAPLDTLQDFDPETDDTVLINNVRQDLVNAGFQNYVFRLPVERFDAVSGEWTVLIQNKTTKTNQRFIRVSDLNPDVFIQNEIVMREVRIPFLDFPREQIPAWTDGFMVCPDTVTPQTTPCQQYPGTSMIRRDGAPLCSSCYPRPTYPFPGTHVWDVVYYHAGQARTITLANAVCPPPICTINSETGAGTCVSGGPCTGSTVQVTYFEGMAGFDASGAYCLNNTGGGNYSALYQPMYSGGLENLINFQEDWEWDRNANGVIDASDTNTLFYSGALIVPWHSEELIKPNKLSKAYYDTIYYTAPKRIFDYNARLAEKPPPTPPTIYAVVRERYQDLGVLDTND